MTRARRVARVGRLVAGSIALELVLDGGAVALAEFAYPVTGRIGLAVAGLVVVGSIPLLALNVVRVAAFEWRSHRREGGNE